MTSRPRRAGSAVLGIVIEVTALDGRQHRTLRKTSLQQKADLFVALLRVGRDGTELTAPDLARASRFIVDQPRLNFVQRSPAMPWLCNSATMGLLP